MVIPEVDLVVSQSRSRQRAAEALAPKIDRLQTRLLEAQIKGEELRNAKLASDIRLAEQPGQPPGLPSSKNIPLTIEVFDPATKKMVTVLNPDAGDSEPLQAWSFVRDSSPDFMVNDSRMAGSLAWKYIRAKDTEFKSKLRSNKFLQRLRGAAASPSYYQQKKNIERR